VNASLPAGNRASRPWAVKNLQPLPAIAVRLMRLVSTDDVVFQRVADLIRVDPAFSAEVMRLANSPLLGCRDGAHGIMHALAILGLDRLKGLVMTVALRNFLSSALEDPLLLRCWRHSLASAVLCEELASASMLPKDRCYTAALLHDLGRLALLATYPQDYAELLREADECDLRESDLLERERDRFDADHTEVGAWLAEDWQFPAEYVEVTRHHHDTSAPHGFGLLTAVQLSCRIADMLGFQVAGAAPLTSIEELKPQFPGCIWERVRPENDLLLEVASKVNALECSLL
jgi:putative nucleotidyltransferase with HDIG domain